VVYALAHALTVVRSTFDIRKGFACRRVCTHATAVTYILCSVRSVGRSLSLR